MSEREEPSALRGLEKAVRTAGTGMLFALFGVGGVLLATVAIPVLGLFRSRGESRELLAQRVIHHSFRGFTGLGARLGLLGLRVHGIEALREPGTLVVANHPTLLDVVYLIAQMPQADCVVKRGAWANPMLRPVVRVCGYIPNDGGEAVVRACAERLARGRSVILFPEGSRSPGRGPGEFRRGAAHVALASGRPITPVIIDCRPPALKKGQAWYALPNERLDFSLEVAPPVRTADWANEDLPRRVAARRVTQELRNVFASRLADGIS